MHTSIPEEDGRPPQRRIVEAQAPEAIEIVDGSEHAPDERGGWSNLVSVMQVVLPAGRAIRADDGGAAPGNVAEVASDLRELPKFMSYEEVMQAAEDLHAVDFVCPVEVFDALTLHCDELRALRQEQNEEAAQAKRFPRVEFEFHTRIRRQDGQPRGVVASQTSTRERELAGDKAAWFRLSVSLGFWLCATREQRLQAMHHACMRCDIEKNESGIEKPVTRRPDVCVFTATAARLGVVDRAMAELWQALQDHPETEPRALEYGFGADGQGQLFAALDTDALLR